MDRVLSLRQKFVDGSHTTFEFYTYVVNASLISAIGLITDNSGVVIASMLISPIMNFVLAFALGVLFKDAVLLRNGVKGMMISLVVCVATGVLAGFLYHDRLKLTNEMMVRTEGDNLYWSLMIAFFSGLSASASIIDENINNMVGVAISTSILPPLVNFGILLPSVYFDKITMRQCLFSLWLSVGNVVIIILSCLCLILCYLRFHRTWLSEMLLVARQKDLERESTTHIFPISSP